MTRSAKLMAAMHEVQDRTDKLVTQTLTKQLDALQTVIDRAKGETDQQREDAHKQMMGSVKAGFKPLFKMAGSQHTQQLNNEPTASAVHQLSHS